jgi:hypothetical protein
MKYGFFIYPVEASLKGVNGPKYSTFFHFRPWDRLPLNISLSRLNHMRVVSSPESKLSDANDDVLVGVAVGVAVNALF